MGLPCEQKNEGDDKGDGHEHVNHHPPHVHEEVAELGIAAESPDDRGQRTEADGGRQKQIGDAEENLAEVRQMLFPGIVLEVRVRHERGHGLKDGAGEHHSLAVRIQRHPRLERQNQIAEDEQQGVEKKQRAGILLPVLGAAVQAFFEPAQDRQRPVFSIHDPRHVAT